MLKTVSKPILTDGVAAIAFNADRSLVAIAPNNSFEILIFSTLLNQDYSQWTLQHVLEEHTQQVCSLDWHPETNLLASASHDRNAFIWTLKEGKWRQSLVILPKNNRAALSISWSGQGTKFALGSGTKRLFIGYYEEKEHWWTGKSIRVHKSSVLMARFDSTARVVATASTDRKCCVLSCYLPETDKDLQQGVYANVDSFGEVLLKVNCSAWVNDVYWNPTDTSLACVTHDSCIFFQETKTPIAPPQIIQWKNLPFTQIKFLSPNLVVVGGHDRVPVLLSRKGEGEWEMNIELDKKEETGSNGPEKVKSIVQERMAMFSKKTLGEEGHSRPSDLFLKIGGTKHPNVILQGMFQPKTESQVLSGMKAFGLAPGARKMMGWELKHAREAIESTVYITFTSPSSKESCGCFRVGSESLCFCGHKFTSHKHSMSPFRTGCENPKCTCPKFAFMFARPEQLGMYWMPRRKGFKLSEWAAGCKCKHSHADHNPKSLGCKICGCYSYMGDFPCISCDQPWEEHQTTYETERERRIEGKPVLDAFLPLADNPITQEEMIKQIDGGRGRMVEEEKKQPLALMPSDRGKLPRPVPEESKDEYMIFNIAPPGAPMPVNLAIKKGVNYRPAQKGPPEKSVRLMQEKGIGQKKRASKEKGVIGGVEGKAMYKK